ncbi:hypothetical protein [Rhodococcus tukisamuensis]|nr:hypothetical protein [Rhodococcus tukisamuensis]
MTAAGYRTRTRTNPTVPATVSPHRRNQPVSSESINPLISNTGNAPRTEFSGNPDPSESSRTPTEPDAGNASYTCADVLFPLDDGTPSAEGACSVLFHALDKAFKVGEFATSAFDRLCNGAPVTTGDLSELA